MENEVSDSSLNLTSEENNSEGYIDDYSHVVKLSYFQKYNNQSDLSPNISFDDTSENNTEKEEVTELNVQKEETNFEKKIREMRQEFLSKNYELQSPSKVVVSMISSATSDMGTLFKYDNMERNEKDGLLNVNSEINTIKFSLTPSRRSTMKFAK